MADRLIIQTFIGLRLNLVFKPLKTLIQH